MWKFWKIGRVDENKDICEKRVNVEDKIHRWLWEEGFDVRKTGGFNSNFRYVVVKDRLPRFSVGQIQGKEDSVFIESGIGFGGIEKSALAKIFDHDQDLSWEIRLHLVSRGFFYKIQPPDLNSNNPGGIVLAKIVYCEELTKAKFIDTVFQVVNTTILIILSLQRHLTTSAKELAEGPNSLPYLR